PPGEVVEEESGTGRIGTAGPDEVVRLCVVEQRDLAEQAQPLSRLAQLPETPLRVAESLPPDVFDPVNVPRQEPDCLAIPREPDRFPGLPHAREAALQTRIGRVSKAPHRLRRGARRDEVSRDVVPEQVLEDVR